MSSFPGLTRKLIRQWDRHAARYDRMSQPMEHMLGFEENRARLFEGLGGEVLELGAGTGRNPLHYPQNAWVLASDLSRNMLAQMRRKARALARTVPCVLADAEDLPFRDGSFDAIVATGVFCCVPDPVRGFREARRVLKPGGRLLLIEHVQPGGLMGWVFDLMDPLVSRLMGPHINRATVESLRAAGLAVIREENLHSDWVKLIVAQSIEGERQWQPR